MLPVHPDHIVGATVTDVRAGVTGLHAFLLLGVELMVL